MPAALTLPIGIAFLGADDLFVIEKDSGRVQRVTGGVVSAHRCWTSASTAHSERGLLGIALHPDFPDNPGVYLYWTCRTRRRPADPFFARPRRNASTQNMFLADSADVLAGPAARPSRRSVRVERLDARLRLAT